MNSQEKTRNWQQTLLTAGNILSPAVIGFLVDQFLPFPILTLVGTIYSFLHLSTTIMARTIVMCRPTKFAGYEEL